MLEKSKTVDADTIVYDLEDSVAPNDKDSARQQLREFLEVRYMML